jgi:hypothetical protein
VYLVFTTNDFPWLTIIVVFLRYVYVEIDRSRGIFFTLDWVSLPGVLPVASGGIHVWHMPALTEIFGDDFYPIWEAASVDEWLYNGGPYELIVLHFLLGVACYGEEDERKDADFRENANRQDHHPRGREQ